MARQTNIIKLTCDRCGKTAYLSEGDQRITSEWRDIQRVTADNVTTGNLLCSDCYPAYRQLAVSQDGAYNQYLANKTDNQGA